MTEPTMIERIARALCGVDGHPENATIEGKPLWEDYLPEARAAISAMQQPTAPMLETGADMVPGDDLASHRQVALEVWQGMVGQALAEH